MNLRFVEAFYWVATLKSVSRAAEKLFLTQSAMSARIAALEVELGALLLDRRDKQFRLTVAGGRFVIYARQLLELQREIKTEMGSGQTMQASLRIGAIESVLHSWLIPWIEKLRAEQPGLELELTVETTPVLMD
jgi:DNA-binding transcriptional LysR family regulator